jgi:DNA-binding GntR family transcriptional regulator
MASNRFPDWQLYEYMFRHPELLQVSLPREYQEHKAIAEAIAAHDPEKAAQAAVQHVRNLGHELVEYLGIPAELLSEKESQINTTVTFMGEKL